MKHFALKIFTSFTILILLFSSSCSINSSGGSEQKGDIDSVVEDNDSLENTLPMSFLDSVIDSIHKRDSHVFCKDIIVDSDSKIRNQDGLLFTGKVYSNSLSDKNGICYEDVIDGEVIRISFYYPNGQLAFRSGDEMSYKGVFYSPRGDVITFDSYSKNYWHFWHEHEYEIPLTLICPACLDDFSAWEKEGDSYVPDNNAIYRLQNKNKGGMTKIIKHK